MKYVRVNAEAIPDTRVRAAFRELDMTLRPLVEAVNALTQTDRERGGIKTSQPVVLPDLGWDPELRSTYGKPGEVRRFGNRAFMKIGNIGEDTDWWELATSGTSPSIPLVPVVRQVIAGDGLTGGGPLTADVTLDVVAADGSIVVAADSVVVGYDHDFPWSGAHHYTSGPTETPIRITAADDQSVPLVRVEKGAADDWLQVDERGLVGLSDDDPDALLSIKVRPLTDRDILNLPGGRPWAWWDAADWNGDWTDETPANETTISTWGDKANYPSTLRSLTHPTPADGMQFYSTAVQRRKPGGLPGSATNAYLSQYRPSPADTTPDLYYQRLLGGDGQSPEFAAWTVIAVAANLYTGAGVPQHIFGTPKALAVTHSDLALPGTTNDDAYCRCIKKDYTGGPGGETFSGAGGAKPVPDRTKFCLYVCSHTAGDTSVSVQVDGTAFSCPLVSSNYGKPWYFQYLGGFDNSTFAITNLFYADVLVFDRILSAGDMAIAVARMNAKYGKSGPTGAGFDPLRLKNLAGTTLVDVDEDLRLGLGVGTTPGARLDVAPVSADEIGSRVTAIAGQTEDLDEWVDEDLVIQSRVASDASFHFQAPPTFEPAATTSPFVLGANALGELVTGLNADEIDGHDWSDVASAYAIDYASVALTGIVTLFGTALWYDGPSVSLGEGTWLILAHGTFKTNNVATAHRVTMRLIDSTDTTTIASVEGAAPSQGASTVGWLGLSCFGFRSVAAGGETWKIAARSAALSEIMRNTTEYGDALATQISAIRIA